MQPHHTLADRAQDNIRFRRRSLKHPAHTRSGMSRTISHSEHFGFWRPTVVRAKKRLGTEEYTEEHSSDPGTSAISSQVHILKHVQKTSFIVVCVHFRSQIPHQSLASWKSEHHCGVASPNSPRVNVANKRPIPLLEDQASRSSAEYVRMFKVSVKTVKVPVKTVLTRGKTNQVHTWSTAASTLQASITSKRCYFKRKTHQVHTTKLRSSRTRSEKTQTPQPPQQADPFNCGRVMFLSTGHWCLGIECIFRWSGIFNVLQGCSVVLHFDAVRLYSVGANVDEKYADRVFVSGQLGGGILSLFESDLHRHLPISRFLPCMSEGLDLLSCGFIFEVNVGAFFQQDVDSTVTVSVFTLKFAVSPKFDSVFLSAACD